jgi:hypothetical protein
VEVDVRAVRERMYRAPTPRERERCHAVWLLIEGWSVAQATDALEPPQLSKREVEYAFLHTNHRISPARQSL